MFIKLSYHANCHPNVVPPYVGISVKKRQDVRNQWDYLLRSSEGCCGPVLTSSFIHLHVEIQHLNFWVSDTAIIQYVLPRVGFPVDESWTEEEIQIAGKCWESGSFSWKEKETLSNTIKLAGSHFYAATSCFEWLFFKASHFVFVPLCGKISAMSISKACLDVGT